MKRYEKYVAVDLPWYPNGIPAHWTTLRHKNVLHQHKELVGDKASQYTLLSLTLKGVIIRDLSEGKGKFSKDYDKYVVVNKGDFVFCLFDVDETPRTVGLSPHNGMITGAYDVFTPYNINPEYFYYYYLSLDNVKALKPLYSGLRKVIPYPSFMATKFPVPSREEQDQIVRFLDYKISKINSLIKGYQKQIKLLEEQKLSFINSAVTGQFSAFPMQFVNSNWVSQIPAHWKFEKIKQHFTIKKRIAGKEGYDVISITQQGLKVKDITKNEGQMAASYAKYQFVYPGEYAMNHMDLLTGYIGLSDHFGVTSPDYRVFAINDLNICDPEYFLYVFQLGYKRKIFYGLGRGAANKGRWRMPAVNFKNYDIPLPPLEEQKEIVRRIKKQQEKIDTGITEVQKEIDLLREYRTRLISDVVTGQIDVRDEVIPEYTAVEDEPEQTEENEENNLLEDGEENI